MVTLILASAPAFAADATSTTATTTPETATTTTTTTTAPQPGTPLGVAWHTPSSGPAGTQITASGTGCVHEGVPGVGSAWLSGLEGTSEVYAEAPADRAGDWSVSLTVRSGWPAGSYYVGYACGQRPDDHGFVYGVGSFTVTTTAAPPASPATPVQATPRFTG